METDKRTETMEVSADERELIEVLRNFRRAWPNGSKVMDLEIQELIFRLKGFE